MDKTVDNPSKSHLTAYYASAKKAGVLPGITIELTRRCNWSCKHCYIPSHEGEGLSYAFIESLFQDLRLMGTLDITLTGGEIFLRDDVFEIIELARMMFFRVTIFSNASLLDEIKVKNLARLAISEYTVTIFSMNAAVHDSITQIKGSWSKAMNGIMLLKKHGILVEIKTPLLDENKFEFKEISEFCKNNGFKFMSDPSIMYKIDGDDSPGKIRVKNSDLENVMRGLRDISDDSEALRRPYNKDAFACSILKFTLSVDCNGDVFPCNAYFHSVGNAYVSKVSDIWRKSHELKQIHDRRNTELTECNTCDLVEYCYRCPGTALLEDGDCLGCSTMALEQAKIRKILYEKEVRNNEI